ncbi:NUDIX hydrolase [Alkalihalobacillus sp. LMS39]|uniref:NUDIX domain-containing protein n=1 Tax=Alkalihalobacillus sp. LMS39 TaxID=2924032 RepID=UPI001FB2D2F1|nr:NUDIX hydrolase [Alkalihalobacillus sp. LMS39]UOE96119.1 NUDIX hydrolase [Alkalihalobacillus sp. LMS39]
MDEHLYEKTISTTPIYKGRVIDLEIDEVELPDGKTSKRELVRHPGAVAIIAVTTEGKLVVVRQYRKALDRVIVEIPAGKLEINEDPLECAMRELEEETGYKAVSLQYVTSFYTSPGFADEIVHLYFTDSLRHGTCQTDDDEFVEQIEITLEEALELIQTKEIYDAKTAYAVQYLQLLHINR